MIRYWNTFNGKPNRANSGKVRVSISPKSVILLNMLAFEALKRPAAVELMFDQTYGIIGLKPAKLEAHNAFPVVNAIKGYYRRINAASFCRHFNIQVDKTMLFLEPTVEPDGVLELSLTKTMTVTRGSR